MNKMVDGVEIEMTPEEIEAFEASRRIVPTTQMVNEERSRRILVGGIFDGVYIKGDDTNRANLSDLAFAAMLRRSVGDNTTITVFRDSNNEDHELTPEDVISVWQQAAGYVSMLYDRSWAIKALVPIPDDFAADIRWQAE